MWNRTGNRNRRTVRNSLAGMAEFCEQRQMLSAVYASVDGKDNNVDNPAWGSTEIELVRLSAAEYADNFSSPAGSDRPSARAISNAIAAQTESISNDRNMSDFVWAWGQFLDHDIDLSEGAEPAEAFNIDVPAGDPFFDPFNQGNVQIGLNRTVYVEGAESSDGLRQQLNQITAYIDGSVVYGSDQVRADELRTFSGGKLKTSAGDLLPFNENGLPNAGGTSDTLFLAGDVRANENALLSSMQTLFVREHNRIADELAAADPSLTDEDIYQQARSIVAAEIQAITYNEFLPALTGTQTMPAYAGYDPTVNPGIANEFSTAAYRLGHSLLSSDLQRIDADGNVIAAGNLSLSEAFFNAAPLVDHGIDSLLRGASTQAAQELDSLIVDDVRNFLFGPPGAGGLDLASLNIQRGRDHGLADYNQTRVDIGLPAVTSFAEITSDPVLAQALEDTYGSVDNIDLWVGGLAEDHLPGSSLGQTFTWIIVDQFSRIRTGDRYWYQNVFTGNQLAELEQTRLSDIIERNTDITGLQENVFFLRGTEIVEIDLAQHNASTVTIEPVGTQLHITDQISGQVIFARELTDLGGLVIQGTHNVRERVTISTEFASGDLPFGIRLDGGYDGNDRLTVLGTDGDDTIRIEEHLISANDLDIVYGEFEKIVVLGNAGDDDIRIDSTSGRSLTLRGGDGDDTLIGGAGHDLIFGGAGDDLIIGNDGDDYLFGGRGSDRIFGGGGTDIIHGGAGMDFVLHEAECDTPEEWAAYAAHLGSMLNLRTTGNYFENWGGAGERWVWGNGGWYFITPDGSLYLWDHTHRQATGKLIVTLTPEYFHNPQKILNHQHTNVDGDASDSMAHVADQLSHALRLRTTGNYFENWGGAGERWIWGNGGWHFITPDGSLYRWDGIHRQATGLLIAELSVDYFDDPSILSFDQ